MAGTIAGSSPGTAMTENRKLDDMERPPTANAIRAKLSHRALAAGRLDPKAASLGALQPTPKAEAPRTERLQLSTRSVEGEKRADGDVTEVRLARIKVMDQVAAARRRLGGLGRPGCVST